MGHINERIRRRSMTKDDRDYIEEQLHNIQAKQTDEELNRYVSLFTTAALTDEVKYYLHKACKVRREELKGKGPPMAVSSEVGTFWQ